MLSGSYALMLVVQMNICSGKSLVQETLVRVCIQKERAIGMGAADFSGQTLSLCTFLGRRSAARKSERETETVGECGG